MKRNKVIDFFRGVAILSVLVYHIFLVQPLLNKNFFLQTIYFVSKGGWIGVDLFFVLSGFLISGLIFKEYDRYEQFNMSRFLIRRGFKIYPLYYIVILAGVLFYPLILHQQFSDKDLLAELFFLVNYVNSGNPALGHLWSLAVEEHFYIFLSLFLFVLIRHKKLSFAVFVQTYLLFLLVGFTFRTINFYQSQGSWWKIFPLSYNRFDSLFFGVLLSYAFLYEPDFIKVITGSRIILIVAICILSLNFFSWIPWSVKCTVLLGLNPVCFGVVMISFLQSRKTENHKLINSLAFVGKYSYAIYIFHPLIVSSVKIRYGNMPAVFYPLSFLLSAVGGILLSKLIEIPFLKVRDKFFPARSHISDTSLFIPLIPGKNSDSRC